MLNKVYRFFEYAYLVVALFFAFEAANNWNTEPNRAYLYIFFVAVAIGMFFFKRNFRRRMERDNK